MNTLVLMLGSLGGAGEPPIPLTRDERVEDFRERGRQINLMLARTRLHGLQLDIERLNLQIAAAAEVTGRLKKAALFRQNQEAMQAELQKFLKKERLLWEQQPGGILAPPPRAKTSIQPQGGQP